ncbi:uncharacterized protein TNCV_4588051 [Trichonephila clavipes]|uniref:Uncharacterized protein n=1 Tax=Trichonephila clavipes TaxID=2585209 RepID=A0A8X6VD93_TRICX|nr:uncharacterized protein TNCV_4588051 [Trichonephila clavipes]
MTTTSYRSHSAVGVLHLFPLRQYSAVRSCLVARGTMTTNSYHGRATVGFRILFSSRHNRAVRSRLGARGTMATTSYRRHSAVGVRPFFPSRQYSAVRLRLGARGTMTTTFYRSRSGSGVRHFFRRGTTLLSDRVLVHAERCQLYATAWRGACLSNFSVLFVGTTLLSGRVFVRARGTMTTTCYRVRAAVGVRHLFSVEALLCCPVASWCTRNDDNDNLPWTLSVGCSSLFFRRGTTLVSGCVLLHAER